VALTIVTREQWGAKYGRSSNRVALSSRRYFVAHYPAAAGAITNEVASVRSIEQQHANQGWSARPGYNFLIGMSGTIYEGCGRDVQGVHCPGRNTDGFGVCFLQGGHAPAMGVQAFSDAAKASGRALYDQLCRDTGRTLEQGWHGKYYATACAGPDIIAWVRAGMPATPAPQPPEPTPPAPAPTTEEVGNMVLQDPVTGGYWVVDGPSGGVHALAGAPFLGGANNAKLNPKKYPCVGIGRLVDAQKQEAYALVLDWGKDGGAEGRFRLYRFPRNGSAKS
jgi:hypothetical protein